MMPALLRLVVSLAVALGAALIAALAVALADLYLTGHGYRSITTETIALEGWGVHLSFGDVILLLAAFVSGILSWLVVR